ncbi:MAG: lamin tail domain-containing protein [Candidatus Woesearchaeota archaeon]
MAFGKEKQFDRLNKLLTNSFTNLKNDVLRIHQRIDQIEATMASANPGSLREHMEWQEKEIQEIKDLVAQNAARNALAEENKAAQEKESPEERGPGEGEVMITAVQFEAPGSAKDNLNSEWVELEGYNVDMGGWQLHDNDRKHVYKFPEGFSIHGKVRLYTGKGKDTSTKLFWNNANHIWNDDDDTATLKDPKGKIISRVRSARVHSFERLK